MKEFNFWKENKLDQHYTLTKEELITNFCQFLSKKDQDWINYYGSQSIRAFIGDKEIGLNSVGDDKEFHEIDSILHPIVVESMQ